jgi:hypothetical protein
MANLRKTQVICNPPSTLRNYIQLRPHAADKIMNEKRFLFWRNWLFWANVGTVGVGLMAAFWSNNPLLRPWNAGTEATFFGSSALPADEMAMRNWLMGIVGGTIVGFHLLMALIAWFPFLKREKWAWYACWAGLLSWFCIDSGVSAFYGAWHNIYLINAVALVAIGLPLIFTWRAFR